MTVLGAAWPIPMGRQGMVPDEAMDKAMDGILEIQEKPLAEIERDTIQAEYVAMAVDLHSH